MRPILERLSAFPVAVRALVWLAAGTIVLIVALVVALS
jgi:hypothetical protein